MGDRRAGLILLLIFSLAAVSISEIVIVKAEPKTIVVPDDYLTINDAVRNAADGDTVFVKSGTYYENVVIKKSISVKGENKETTTIICTDKNEATVLVQENEVTITELTIKNVVTSQSNSRTNQPALHLLHVSSCNISKNILVNGGYGVWLYGSNNNNISSNLISENNYGIMVESSSDNKISQNTVIDCANGICLEADGNILKNNIMIDNSFDLRVGTHYNHAGYYNDIDTSNHINGKKVHYLINKKNIEINSQLFPDVGFLALVNCEGITVNDLNLADKHKGLVVYNSSNFIISNNSVSNNYYGIEIQNSSNIKIYGNNVSNSGAAGIFVQYSQDITFLENYITTNRIGLQVWKSYNYCIIGNQIENNEYVGIEILGSENITISHNIIKSNENGIYHRRSSYPTFHNPTNGVISHNQIVDNWKTAFTGNVDNSSITKNYICGNGGFGLQIGSNCIVTGNNITQSGSAGIAMQSNNLITGNHISKNEVGFTLKGNDNLIHHNNLIDNTFQITHFRETTSNIWDNQEEGNYWSNYNGTDADGDGIGDTPYIMDESNKDNYPLMAPITFFDAGTWEGTSYGVNVMSNSTVSDFSFNPQDALIRFDVEGETGTTGFCRVTIPKDLLDTEGDWTVLVDGASVAPSVNVEASNTYLYFTYQHSIKTVEIIGTDAIPEFPSWIILPLFLMATLSAIIVKKRLFRSTP